MSDDRVRQHLEATGKAIHYVVPDTQCKPGIPLEYLAWIGQYFVDTLGGRENVKLIHLGDHADMPSLSSYDRGKKAMEGRRYIEDIRAANAGFDELCRPFEEYNARRRQLKERTWQPELHYITGNHDQRIVVASELDARLEGILTLDDLNYTEHGFTVHPFLKPVELDGLVYAHFFQNSMTGKPLGGNALMRLKNLGFSFVMGHQQLLETAVRYVNGRQQRALIAGAAYAHNEDYRGFQGNQDHWRGVLVLFEVEDGGYSLMEVSMDYLARRYAGMTLAQYQQENQLQ